MVHILKWVSGSTINSTTKGAKNGQCRCGIDSPRRLVTFGNICAVYRLFNVQSPCSLNLSISTGQLQGIIKATTEIQCALHHYYHRKALYVTSKTVLTVLLLMKKKLTGLFSIVIFNRGSTLYGIECNHFITTVTHNWSFGRFYLYTGCPRTFYEKNIGLQDNSATKYRTFCLNYRTS